MGMSPSCAAAPGQVLTDGPQVCPGLATAERGQTLGDAGYRFAVAEDLQGHLQAVQVVYRQQQSLGLAVACQGYPLMLLAYSPRQLRQAGLGLGYRHGVAAILIVRTIAWPSSGFFDGRSWGFCQAVYDNGAFGWDGGLGASPGAACAGVLTAPPVL